MRIVQVSLGPRSYDIKVNGGLLPQIGDECARRKLGRRCAIITDSNVGNLYSKAALKSLSKAGFEPVLLTVPAGENSKRLSVVEKCYDQLTAHRLDRASFIVALGGGVIGDVAGFVAATYLRGIPFVQMPTTLLAQVDSSVGGKTGVNLRAGKNLAGAFYQPRLVLCDLEVLKTLPDRDYISGLAEVIKYGIIYDAKFFRHLERNMEKILGRDAIQLSRIVARCCEIKAEVVGHDETENGLRAILNFGHTIGHAIENSFGYGKFMHGEAISIGQVAAAKLSRKILGLPTQEVERIERLFLRVGLPVKIQLNFAQRKKLFEAMQLDKKASEGEVKFVLASKIGKVVRGCQVPADLIASVLA